MRRQVADQTGPFFWREPHQAASSKASREARLIHHRFFASVGFRAVVGEPIHVKFDIVALASRDAQRDGRIKGEKWQSWGGLA